MAVLAVGVAGLAAGCLGVGLGRPLAKRRGLTFAGAEGLLEFAGQFGDPSFEFGHTLEECPTAGTSGFVHAANVTSSPPLSCARWTVALNKYGEVNFGMDTMSTFSGDPEYISQLDFAPVMSRIKSLGFG